MRKAWTLIGLGSFLVLVVALAVFGPGFLTVDGLRESPRIVYGLFIAPVAALLITLLTLFTPPIVRWNVLLLVVILAVAEVLFAAIEVPGPKVEGEPEGLMQNGYYAEDERLGYRVVPDNVARHHQRVDGRTVHDVIYRIDRFGRRETPRAATAPPERFLLFFGGSNTFGEGLEQGETLPYHVTQALPAYRAYNYALHGYGLAQMLDIIETRDLAEQVEEERGVALFYFIPGHMARLVGASNVSPTWGRGFSYYTLAPGGGVEYRGSFSQGRRWLTLGYAFLARSSIARYFGLVLPLEYQDADYELAARVVAESRRRLGEQLDVRRFAVVLAPVIGETQQTIAQRLAGALERYGIEVIDLSQTIDLTELRYRVAKDNYHQSAEANEVLAARLVEDLRRGP